MANSNNLHDCFFERLPEPDETDYTDLVLSVDDLPIQTDAPALSDEQVSLLASDLKAAISEPSIESAN